MTDPEMFAVPLSRGGRDGLLEVVSQLRRESRHVFADRVAAVVRGWDAASAAMADEDEVLLLPSEWSALFGRHIRSATGWGIDSPLGSKLLTERLSLPEYEERCMHSDWGPA